MTLEQAQALTHDEIRVRVAEIRGWTNCCTDNPMGSPKTGPIGCQPGRNGGEIWHEMMSLPNYPADLNACAEFPNFIGRGTDDYVRYCETVRRIVTIAEDCKWPKSHGIDATARQRCQAFVTVMGKDTP